MVHVTTHSQLISPTITVSTDAYAANDCIGGKITLSDAVRKFGGTGILQSIQIRVTDNTKPGLYILFFDSDPTAATLTDNAALALSTDLSKVVATAIIFPSDYVTIGGVAWANVDFGGLVLQSGSSTSNDLYMAIASVAGQTFTATTDLGVKVGISMD